MDDRELLELAAKAAGMALTENGVRDLGQWEWLQHGDKEWGLYANNANGTQRRWNPLTDDADALRLAVKLGMILDIRYTNPMSMKYNEVCFWRKGRESAPYEVIKFGDMETDFYAATRRAIVCAAAQIGAASE